MGDMKNKSESYWKEKLTPEQYRIIREKGTERPFTGTYTHHKESGTYKCAACGQTLFSSETKYDSGSGWPSFWAAADEGAIEYKRDTSHFMIRTEIVCANCGAHLGHIFDDGPQPTGQRFCVNSVSLDFTPEEDAE